MRRGAITVVLVAACGADPIVDTMQDCFDEHHEVEQLSVDLSIVVCCLEHPLGPVGRQVTPACKDTVAACVSYLASDPVGMLSSTSATTSEVITACTDYISRR